MAARDERICCAVRVHKHGLKEVAEFMGRDCSTISIIANNMAEAKKHQE